MTLGIGGLNENSSSTANSKKCQDFLYCFVSSRQGFSIALEPVLELAVVDQAGLKLTEIHLPLPLLLECWD